MAGQPEAAGGPVLRPTTLEAVCANGNANHVSPLRQSAEAAGLSCLLSEWRYAPLEKVLRATVDIDAAHVLRGYVASSEVRKLRAAVAAMLSVVRVPFHVRVDSTSQELILRAYRASLRARAIRDGTIVATALAHPGGSWLAGLFDKSRRLRADPTAVMASLRGVILKKFPRKKDPRCLTKANLYLDCVIADLYAWAPVYARVALSVLSTVRDGIIFEDQVCSCLVFAWAASSRAGFTDTLETALLSVRYPDCAKALTDIIKAMGWQLDDPIGLYTEIQCLVGRGATDVDLLADAQKRLLPTGPHLAAVDPHGVRAAAARVISEELAGKRVMLATTEEHWTRRYEWCVAGAHSATTNPDWGQLSLRPLVPAAPRLTRRMAMEMAGISPLLAWDGTTGVSLAAKKEHGKDRAIYSCSTTNYAAFSRLLRPIEKAWVGEKVILDPGAGGSSGLLNRVLGLWDEHHPWALMLDYEDFNSQHSLDNQKAVTQLLLKHCDDPDPIAAEKLLNSFDKMTIYKDGVEVGPVKSTLMSGHRGTSVLNSILNAAYIRLAIGEHTYKQIHSLHVGDDVLMFCPDYATVVRVIAACRASGLRLQAHKQAAGTNLFEFLRMAGSRSGARGYLARSVASVVCGNWASEWVAAGTDALSSLVQQARALANRSGNLNAWRLMVGSVAQITGLGRGVVCEFLSGDTAIAPGPCFRQDGRYIGRVVTDTVVRPDGQELLPRIRSYWRRLPRNATEAYIGGGLAGVEEAAIGMAGGPPLEEMVRSSYGDLGYESQDLVGCKRLASVGPRIEIVKQGAVSTVGLMVRERQRGLLSHYPVIALLQNRLKARQIATLLAMLGHHVPPEAAREAAFGSDVEGTTVRGTLPYSDACRAAALGIRETVVPTMPVAM